MLLDDLNSQQIPAVKHLNGPALVVAGPGSGKTRVLTQRVAYLIQEIKIPETNILCVTFTNKAAKEIAHRVEQLIGMQKKIPWSGTFHSICSRILRKDGFNIGIPLTFVIYDKDDQISIIKGILKDFGIDPKKTNPRAVSSTISSAKSELVTPQEYKNIAQGYFQKTVAKVYPEYQKRLRNNEALDFDDLLVETVKLFETHPQVLKKYQNLFEYIMVDEYQDTNRAQYILTKLLAQKHNNIFVVGDMAQAIYSFRGADYRNILNFEKDYPDAKIYNLEQNYRSTQNILNAATKIINNNTNHIPLDLWTNKNGGEKITLYTGRNEKEEARFVVEQVRQEIINGRDMNDLAILYRTNAQSRNMEEHLIKSNIPYVIVGGVNFYARKEVKDIIAYLKVIHNPKDTVAWERIINVPPRGLGLKSQEVLAQNGWDIDEIDYKTKLSFSKWIPQKEQFATVELMDEILNATRYIEWLKDQGEENIPKIENIRELRTVATQFTALEDFLENVALIESSSKAQSGAQNAITLMTIHASKGLEFPVVYLIGMEEGLFPHMQSMMELVQLEEERRLCYVAITRAMEKVFLTNANSRMYFGNTQANAPSRFISEIPQDLIESLGTGSNRFIAKHTEEFLDDLDYSRQNFSWE